MKILIPKNMPSEKAQAKALSRHYNTSTLRQGVCFHTVRKYANEPNEMQSYLNEAKHEELNAH